MNASQRLFDRFDKAGPSWLPIIVLSLFGLSATIVSVYAISKTSSSVLKQAIESGFQLSRDVGKSSVYLFDFVAVDKDALSDIESKLVRITSSRNPGMSFLGALDGRPAFPPVSNDDSGQMMELSPPLNRRHYCWIDDLQTTLLICTFDWFEVDVRGTEHEYQPGESLPFSKALAISRVGPTDKSFRSTHASSSLPDLGDHENVLKLILHEAGVISELIDSHRVFVEPMDLVRFEPQDFDVTVQTFFQQRAFAYVNTGGDVLEKRFRDFAEGSNLYEINSNDDKNRIYALLMGVRNGVSKQFDQFVLEKLSRDTMNRANGNSSLPPIVIQPLSCPIRFESLLLRLDGNQIEPMKTDIVLSPDTILDLPADIAERINAFRESGQDIRETAVRFRDVFDQRPELEAVFQMKEPFPATVYMKKESQ